jgi:hypothetical protein
MLSNAGHRALAMLALLCILAACGGGGGGGATLPAPAPTSTPSQAAPQPYALNVTGLGGVAGGTATAYATAAVTVSATATSPTGVALRRRATDSQTPLIYFAIAANASAATVTAFEASITLNASSSGPVSLSQWENGAWVGTNATVTVNGSSVSFDYTLAPAAPAPVYFALYTGQTLSTPSPTTSPTTSPTATSTTAPTASPANACAQTPQPGTQTGGVSDQASSFFTTLQNAQQICLSVWEPSSQVQSALASAATNHAAVTVIYPIEEYSEDASDANALAALGARIIWENDDGSTQSVSSGQSLQTASLPIHAKFALVNGVAYMDGHNWFASDVILQDANAADYAAIQTDLTTFPASPPSVAATAFTTDKYNSLTAEANFISTANPGSGTTLDFISEDFDDYGTPAEAVYAALTAAAQDGATVNVIIEGPSSEFNSYENCDLSTLAHNGAHIYVGSGGSEKIALIEPSGGSTLGWIGSSNMSDYDYIDWGMTLTGNAGVISAMQTYYGNALTNASAYTAGAYSPSCSL